MADYKPFIERNAGDFITAKDWNEMQKSIRESINSHSHNGEADQGPLIDGDSIDIQKELTLKNAKVEKHLEAGSVSVKGKIGINTDEPALDLDVTGDACVAGKFGIGTPRPKGEHHVAGTVVLGADKNNEKFIMHPRHADKGDFLHITHDKKDGSWEWEHGLVIRRSGKVGINTSDPALPLDVSGDACLSGSLGIGTPKPKGKQHVVGDIVLGSDKNDEKFVMHSRTNEKGDFLQVTHDKKDGNWEWGHGLVIHRSGNVGINTSEIGRASCRERV